MNIKDLIGEDIRSINLDIYATVLKVQSTKDFTNYPSGLVVYVQFNSQNNRIAMLDGLTVSANYRYQGEKIEYWINSQLIL